MDWSNWNVGAARLLIVMSTIVRLFVGFALLTSGIEHVRRFELFVVAICRYELLPANLVGFVALGIASGSICVGASLVVRLTRIAAFGSAALFLTFFIAQLLAITFDKPVMCGCFGSFGSEVVGVFSVLRVLLFFLSSCFLVVVAVKIERIQEFDQRPTFVNPH